jgi:hypothetical protein
MVDQGHAAAAGKAGPCSRGAHLARGGVDRDPLQDPSIPIDPIAMNTVRIP